jgi:hypothetical protein
VFVDLDHFYAGPDAVPDATYHPDAEPDADPDSDFYLMRVRLRIHIRSFI